MVLQDGDNPPGSFADNPYPSDNDAYTTGPPSGQRYDASNLPKPISLLGYGSRAIHFRVDRTLEYAETKLHRPLTAEEAQALASHLYKLEMTKSYFKAAGVSAGIYRWFSTFADCRYPFYKPKPEDINPNKFLVVKGPMAHYARHSWRFICYTFVAGQLGSLLGQIFAQPAAARASMHDPKLAQFSQDVKQAITSETARTNNKSARQTADERRAAWEAAVKARPEEKVSAGSPPQAPWSARKPTPVDDDMSPTAGNESWPLVSENAWGDSSFASDAAPNPPPRQQPSNSSSQPTGKPTRQDDDDASPTGGMFQTEVQSQSKSGESAWDRLRRNSASTQQGPPPLWNRSQPPSQERKEGSTLGDSFTFVDGEDERRKERERAQREFDARIEQERQGKDFNEEKRW